MAVEFLSSSQALERGCRHQAREERGGGWKWRSCHYWRSQGGGWGAGWEARCSGLGSSSSSHGSSGSSRVEYGGERGRVGEAIEGLGIEGMIGLLRSR